jgi:hypothetical protein
MLKKLPGVLMPLLLMACSNTAQSGMLRMENKSLVTNRAMNLAIEDYIDQHLSESIRVKNYNRKRVKKVFCAHQTDYIEQTVTVQKSITAYIKLQCAEALLSKENNVKLSNLSLVESRIELNQKSENSFEVFSDETPRGNPFYLDDLKKIIRSDIIDKMHSIPTNKNLNTKIEEKARKFYLPKRT